jgi:glycosyltransferase
MLTLFIFRSNARGMQYGIGTYINELNDALPKLASLNIILVSYNGNSGKEIVVKKANNRLTEITIPAPILHYGHSNKSEIRYANIVVRLLHEFMPENEKVVFQINYFDDLPIANRLKELYQYPVISIVHFAQWQMLFDGNRNKIKGLNIDSPSNNIEYTLFKEKELYLLSDHIVSLTQYMREYLINEYGIDPKKISVIPNGLDQKKFQTIDNEEKSSLKKTLGFSSDDIIILFSGRIDPSKGVLYLVEAFEKAAEKHEHLKLVLIGQGDVNECQRKLGSSFGRVIYTGFLEKRLLKSFYNIADIGIVPSKNEQCSYTVLEMMANRVPIIASRINGLDEILNDNSCLFVNPVITQEGEITLNIDDLAEAMVKLASEKGLRKQLSESAYKIFINKFKSERMAGDMKKLFELITNRTILEPEYEKAERR